MKSVTRLMTVGNVDLPILLHGETGSGKDVFARAIHAASNRARNNYVALNCAAMPESLIDAELFGYEAGAFTGARREGSKGLIVQAGGGTLFLDEIGDMPLALQTRLLRVLETREVWPLGALKPVPVDIRLICATHRDLGCMAEEGTFRSDLYYRLRGMEIRLPALRERADKGDVITQIAKEKPRIAASRPAPGRCCCLIPSQETCASSAMCCGWPAAPPRTASLSKPISIYPRLAAALRSQITPRPSAPLS